MFLTALITLILFLPAATFLSKYFFTRYCTATKAARARAQRSLDKLLTSYDNNLQVLEQTWQYYNLAFYYLMLDEKEKKLYNLGKAVNMGRLRSLANEKIFESIQNDPVSRN